MAIAYCRRRVGAFFSLFCAHFNYHQISKSSAPHTDFNPRQLTGEVIAVPFPTLGALCVIFIQDAGEIS